MNTDTVSRGKTEGRPGGSFERWEIDPTGSALEFTLRHLVLLEIRGRFHRWGGTVFIDRATPSRSYVEAWVDLASVDTGSEERDAHVRSPEFLDVGRYPRARFASTAVDVDDERIRLRGHLQLHGTTREIELEVSPGANTRDDKGVLRSEYNARGTLNRQAFGLHWNQDLDVGGVVVGDRVELSVKAELLRVPNDLPPLGP